MRLRGRNTVSSACDDATFPLESSPDQATIQPARVLLLALTSELKVTDTTEVALAARFQPSHPRPSSICFAREIGLPAQCSISHTTECSRIPPALAASEKGMQRGFGLWTPIGNQEFSVRPPEQKLSSATAVRSPLQSIRYFGMIRVSGVSGICRLESFFFISLVT
jgi:hypothetical protein